jgi:hypothetical protein
MKFYSLNGQTSILQPIRLQGVFKESYIFDGEIFYQDFPDYCKELPLLLRQSLVKISKITKSTYTIKITKKSISIINDENSPVFLDQYITMDKDVLGDYLYEPQQWLDFLHCQCVTLKEATAADVIFNGVIEVTSISND